MNILITGGSQGIGYAIAEACAQRGHSLFLVARDQKKLSRAAKQLHETYGHPVFHRTLDISKPKEVASIVTATKKEKFPVDILCLNAGIWIDGNIATTSPKNFHRIMEVNVASSFYFVHAFRAILRQSLFPRIIITGSTAGLEAHHHNGGSLYSVTKWATHGFAVNLRQELLADGIGVTHIAPGNVVTPMWGKEAQPDRMLHASDIGQMVAGMLELSPQAVVEELVLRPLQGNI